MRFPSSLVSDSWPSGGLFGTRCPATPEASQPLEALWRATRPHVRDSPRSDAERLRDLIAGPASPARIPRAEALARRAFLPLQSLSIVLARFVRASHPINRIPPRARVPRTGMARNWRNASRLKHWDRPSAPCNPPVAGGQAGVSTGPAAAVSLAVRQCRARTPMTRGIQGGLSLPSSGLARLGRFESAVAGIARSQLCTNAPPGSRQTGQESATPASRFSPGERSARTTVGAASGLKEPRAASGDRSKRGAL